jgi:hypothetical protein
VAGWVHPGVVTTIRPARLEDEPELRERSAGQAHCRRAPCAGDPGAGGLPDGPNRGCAQPGWPLAIGFGGDSDGCDTRGKIVKGPSVSSWWPGVSGWSGCGLEDFDGALGSGGFGEFPVAGEQGGVHGFGEGYVGRVVDGEVVP